MRLDICYCCVFLVEFFMDYEDDFICLKELDGSDIEDFGFDYSEDCFLEVSWEFVDKKEIEVICWVLDYMVLYCYNCDCEFWLVK